MSHFVYILKCADKTLYIGYTKNLERRLLEHNTSKKGARYTKARRPVKLIYSEKFKKVGDALRREIEIKSWRREEKLKLVRKAVFL